MNDYEIVVVGGGIAGSSVASVLARAGKRVLVLEQQLEYRDKVRGETIVPWGTLETDGMDLTSTLLDTGGAFAATLVPYDELQPPAAAEAGGLPLSLLCPGASGQLNVGHPEASEALAQKAASDGATVIRGVRDVMVTFGDSPTVRYRDGTNTVEVTPKLVIGADGRHSTVRRQAGIALDERPAVVFGAGLLVRSESGFTEKVALGTEGQTHFLAFPRQDGLTRLYQMVDIARQPDFTGSGRLAHFVESFRQLQSFPAASALADGEVAGPAGGAPMTDAWTTTAPVVPGAVLIGDAAGWNDPILGQGLSVAFRDAHTVADVVSSSADWSAGVFGDYATERQERMRRLAVSAHISTAMRCTFTEDGRERRGRWFAALGSDPVLLGQIMASLAGPERSDTDCFTDEAVAATLAV